MKRYANSFGWLLICALLPGSLSARAAQTPNRYVDARTGVEISVEVDNTMFPPEYTDPPMSAKAVSLDASNVDRALRVAQTALARYPPAFIRKNLKTIYLVQKLTDQNTGVGGFLSAEDKRLYINCEADTDARADKQIEGTIHHEILHVLMANYADKFSAARWKRLNPSQFRYRSKNAADTLDYLRKHADEDREASPAALRRQGFVNIYATYEYNEDVASTAEYLFSGSPQFWESLDHNPILNKKAEMLLAFYHALDSAFTRAYLRQMRPPSVSVLPETAPAALPLSRYQPGDVIVFPYGGKIVLPGFPVRFVNVAAGDSGVYAPGGRFLLALAPPSSAQTAVGSQAPAAPPPPAIPAPPELSPDYSPVWTSSAGWLIYPRARGLRLEEGVFRLRYQAGDTLYFPYGGEIFLPGSAQFFPVSPGHTAAFPDGASILFNPPPEGRP